MGERLTKPLHTSFRSCCGRHTNELSSHHIDSASIFKCEEVWTPGGPGAKDMPYSLDAVEQSQKKDTPPVTPQKITPRVDAMKQLQKTSPAPTLNSITPRVLVTPRSAGDTSESFKSADSSPQIAPRCLLESFTSADSSPQIEPGRLPLSSAESSPGIERSLSSLNIHGWLERRSRGVKTARWCREHVILKTDYLECCMSEKSPYKIHLRVPGRDVWLCEDKNTFVLVAEGGQAIHWRTTPDSGRLQATDWVLALRLAISGNSDSILSEVDTTQSMTEGD